MSIRSKIRRGNTVGVFTRNHAVHLEEACRLSGADRTCRMVFRARLSWDSAAYALGFNEPLPLYIAPIDGDGDVAYLADLHEVHLDPARGDPRTEELLDIAAPTTTGEELWEKSGRKAKTLYVISNCRKLAKPFSMTELVKLSDDEPLSEDYHYSYSVVYARPVSLEDG